MLARNIGDLYLPTHHVGWGLHGKPRQRDRPRTLYNKWAVSVNNTYIVFLDFPPSEVSRTPYSILYLIFPKRYYRANVRRPRTPAEDRADAFTSQLRGCVFAGRVSGGFWTGLILTDPWKSRRFFYRYRINVFRKTGITITEFRVRLVSFRDSSRVTGSFIETSVYDNRWRSQWLQNETCVVARD